MLQYARESVSLSSAGVGLTVLLPSAFVAFPTGETEALPHRPRLRIITAGAFHNIAFWLFLGAVAWARIWDAVWPLVGYRDVRAYGRVVVSVDEVRSALHHAGIGLI